MRDQTYQDVLDYVQKEIGGRGTLSRLELLSFEGPTGSCKCHRCTRPFAAREVVLVAVVDSSDSGESYLYICVDRIACVSRQLAFNSIQVSTRQREMDEIARVVVTPRKDVPE